MKPSTKTLTNKPFLYGKKEFTVEKLEAAIAAYEFKDEVSVDALYDVLNKHLEGLSPFPFEDANELQKFRANMAIFLYNEEGDTEGTSVTYFQNKGLLTVPTNVSKPELALTNKLLELTRGVDSEDNKLAVIIRILSFFYAFTSFDIPPFVFMAAALSIRSVDDLEKHLSWLASKKKLAREAKVTSETNDHKEDEDETLGSTNILLDIMNDPNIVKELNKEENDVLKSMSSLRSYARLIDLSNQKDLDRINSEIFNLDEDTDSSYSSSTSSSSSSMGWGEMALWGLGAVALGAGAMYIASNFIGGGSSDDDIELAPIASL